MKPFLERHLGPSEESQAYMLKVIGASDLEQLVNETVPEEIRLSADLALPEAISEADALRHMRDLGALNRVGNCYIGQGYYPTVTPSVILRNIFENPGWYTQYTPYQAEISQGRLEALMNFQTVISDLTGLPIANASLLDEATAAAEAMLMVYRSRVNSEAHTFLIVGPTLGQTVDVIKTRAEPLGITVICCECGSEPFGESVFGALISYPDAMGHIRDWKQWVTDAKTHQVGVVAACDLMALTLFTPPGEWGVDICVGSAQRFGVPMGYGGPHAGFISALESFVRSMPGRLIGATVDQNGALAYRMALQTREQHIRREKATSNICTAQALLAIMAGMYAVYHGPKGLLEISTRIHRFATRLQGILNALGFSVVEGLIFDTVSIRVSDSVRQAIHSHAQDQCIYLGYPTSSIVQIALDETTTEADFSLLVTLFSRVAGKSPTYTHADHPGYSQLVRRTLFCTHPVFSQHHSETQMLRYIKSLEAKDLSLTTSMIPLGSCTMKLNATTQMMPLSWPEWSNMHPFMPLNHAQGYAQLIQNLSEYLCRITGFAACSLQPNSGAQGEYAGLLAIRRYHLSRQDGDRRIILIPTSAHGTNPATATLTGFSIELVKCDLQGNIDVEDLTLKAEKHASQLAGLMMTYPSTHGVFESAVKQICDIIHQHGGLVYMDGANMNAQVGLTSPAAIGADVCHLNLHKTFAIPHGGGGPGMGPICVTKALAPFLPGHTRGKWGVPAQGAVSAAEFGSASILIISYLYIRMLGWDGVTQATRIAILNANYLKARLETHYSVLYQGEQGRVAHELILDLRPFKKASKIEPEDVAKRLMDYGFHAPTMSFPVPGTLMIEPTESEDLAELDRFCEAMIAIRGEIEAIIQGQADLTDNCLKQAPHTAIEVTSDTWTHAYTRQQAAYPVAYLKSGKFWPPVKRVDNAYGDRNLMCTCGSVESTV
jgi:glycine dehydrogenase